MRPDWSKIYPNGFVSMGMRDTIATMVFTTILAKERVHPDRFKELAKFSYRAADAMSAARDEIKTPEE